MLRTLIYLGCILSSSAFGFDHQHSKWNEVLKAYQTSDGSVRYKLLKADVTKVSTHPLTTYLADLSAVSKAEYETWTRDQKMAFLINSYNAFTFKLIIDHYPVKSIKDIGSLFKSPWKKEFFSLLGGTIKQLDPIEHDILRPQFKDARVHAAVNCASISCPRLQSTAFVADKLEAQLEAAFRGFMADPTRNRFEPEKGALYLSKIFDWFEKDFEPTGGILKSVEKWGPETAREAITKGGKYEFIKYNWGLNDAADVAAVTDTRTN